MSDGTSNPIAAKLRSTPKCRCMARSPSECCCQVDWPEHFIKIAADEIDRLQRLLDARPSYYCKQCRCESCGNTFAGNPQEATGLQCEKDGVCALVSRNDDEWHCTACNGDFVRKQPVEPPPAEATGGYLSGWVIEGAWSPVDRPEYWAGSSIWSADAYKALRFATRESAQQAADLMCAGVNVRIACHEWAMEEPRNEQ